jgi:type I restriction enzyme M protein
MVAVMQPTLADIIQDPAAGTGGFLIAANRYLREHSDPDRWTEAQQRKYRRNTFYGMEHVQDAHRLALMNLMLHGLDSDPDAAGIHYGDTLGQEGETLCKQGATLILTNPPFGTKKGGGLPTRMTSPSHQQQAVLLPEHIYRGLKPGGRAAVVQPTMCCSRATPAGRSGRPDGQMQPAPSCACPLASSIAGCEDQCAVLYPRRDGQGQHRKSGSTTCANMPQFGKPHRAHARALHRVRDRMSATIPSRRQESGSAQGHGEAGRFPPLHL